MISRLAVLRMPVNIGQHRYISCGNASRHFTPRTLRQEAMARRRDVSIAQMNELYAKVNSNHFGHQANRRRVIDSQLLDGITKESSGEDMASRFSTFVLTKDSPYLEEFDRVMTQGFTSGGVEPLTTALMDSEVAKGLNQQPLTKEGFAEFVRGAREFALDDNLSIAILVNPSGTTDDWEVAGVMIQFLEGYVAKSLEAQEDFSKLNDEDRAKWVKEGRAIPRGLDFSEKVMGKFPWAEHLGGTLDMFDAMKLLYGPDPITHQDNISYPFMTGVEPKYQGFGLGSLLFQAFEAQNYAKGIDATIGEFTSISRALARIFSWKKHKEVLYKGYKVWRYLASDGTYHIPPDGCRYTQEEMLSKGLAGEHKYKPWDDIDWEGPPHYQKTDKTQYKPNVSYASGWPSGPGGKRYAIPSVIRGGVAAYKTFPSPLPVVCDENVLSPTA